MSASFLQRIATCAGKWQMRDLGNPTCGPSAGDAEISASKEHTGFKDGNCHTFPLSSNWGSFLLAFFQNLLSPRVFRDLRAVNPWHAALLFSACSRSQKRECELSPILGSPHSLKLQYSFLACSGSYRESLAMTAAHCQSPSYPPVFASWSLALIK